MKTPFLVMVIMIIMVPGVVFAQQSDCVKSYDSYGNLVITCPNQQTQQQTTQQTASSPSPTTSQTPQDPTGGIVSNGLNGLQTFVQNVIGGSGNTGLQQTANGWFNTLGKFRDFVFSFHNSTATTISSNSPVPISQQDIWYIGLGITAFFAIIVIFRILKWFLLVIGIVVVIIVAVMEYKILTP